MKIKDLLFAFVGVIISIFLIYITFSKIDISLFFHHLSKFKLSYIGLFLLSTFFEIFFRTLKWYIILKSFTDIEMNKIFRFEVISLGVNNILPFRMGELTKVFLVSKYYHLSKTTVLSTVFIERLIDTVMLFLLLISYSIVGGIAIPFIDKKNAVYIIISIVLFIYIFFVYSEKIAHKELLKKFEKKHPYIHSVFIKIRNGGLCFHKTSATLLIITTAALQWHFDVLNNYIVAKALSIDLITFAKAALTVVAGSLSTSIPSMPGYFGNYEYAISRLCMLWGVERELGTLFAALIHIISYITITLAALIFIYYEGINIKNLISSKGR